MFFITADKLPERKSLGKTQLTTPSYFVFAKAFELRMILRIKPAIK